MLGIQPLHRHQDFVLDFRRCAALGVLKQHLRLAARAEDKRRRGGVACSGLDGEIWEKWGVSINPYQNARK